VAFIRTRKRTPWTNTQDTTLTPPERGWTLAEIDRYPNVTDEQREVCRHNATRFARLKARLDERGPDALEPRRAGAASGLLTFLSAPPDSRRLDELNQPR